jgi:hypothetical protein
MSIEEETARCNELRGLFQDLAAQMDPANHILRNEWMVLEETVGIYHLHLQAGRLHRNL